MRPVNHPTLSYLAYGTAAIGGAVAFGMILYLAVSFFVMRAHVAPRPLHATLRELFRETLWVVFTQPLVPLYYLHGHRMGGSGPGDPIVFVHGYFQNRANFVGLARAIRDAGIAPMFGFNYPWIARVEPNAARLLSFVERVCKGTGRAHVTLVAHSLGGLVALEYMLHTEAGRARVRRCVTIATPHAGVRWRGPILGEVGAQMRHGCAYIEDRAGHTIAVPTLSIFSTHDNMVYPPETSRLAMRGGRDVAVEGVGHLAILFDRRVIRNVLDFLREETEAKMTA
jgi:pimeloyl-ACP methyl ester carboxylesterase